MFSRIFYLPTIAGFGFSSGYALVSLSVFHNVYWGLIGVLVAGIFGLASLLLKSDYDLYHNQ